MTTAAGLTDNRTLLEKADLALADLTIGGGLLAPAQAQRFMRIMIKASRLLGMTTVVPLSSPKQAIPKIRFSQRVLHAGFEARALPAADRAKPEFSKIEFDAQLFKGEVRLDNEVLEDNIERGELKNTIMQLIAEAISRDVEEIAIQGDVNSADPYLSRLDGILKQATSHVVDAGGDTLSKTTFRDMLRAMPSEFTRDKRSLRFLASTNSEINYRDFLADRATVLGDKFLEQEAPVNYMGIPLEDIPMMPENLGVGFNTSAVLFTDPKNINVGIWRQIRIETDKDVSAGVLIIVVSTRFDVKYLEEGAVVKAYNVGLV